MRTNPPFCTAFPSLLLAWVLGGCASSDDRPPTPLAPEAPSPSPSEGSFDAANRAFEDGRYAEAAELYERALDSAPAPGQDGGGGQEWYRYGYALHVSGNLQRALAAHERATEFPKVAPIAAYNLACSHALLGQEDEAFAALERAVGYGFKGIAQLDGDPDLASLRGDPRWADLRAKVEEAASKGG